MNFKLNDDFKEMIKHALIEAGGDITEKIEDRYEKSVTAFYKSYNPHIYKRTYSTYQASDHYIKSGNKSRRRKIYKVLVNNNRIFVVCGIKVSEDILLRNRNQIDPYDAGVDYVLPRTIDMGIHGFTEFDYQGDWLLHRMEPSIYKFPTSQTMENYIDMITNRVSNKSGMIDKIINKRISEFI